MASAQRILIVEDEDVLAQNVKHYLGRRSADVRIASTGRLAMELLESFVPDVLVLDFNLPGENGLQIYAEILRRRVRPIGCVMITGYPLGTISRTAGELGIRHLLGKPFRLAELQRLVDQSAEELSHPAY